MTRSFTHQRFLVDNAQETARLFHDLFGWDIRWEGIVLGQSYVIHMDAGQDRGEDRFVTLSDRGPMATDWDETGGRIGIDVEDLEAVSRRAGRLGILMQDCLCAQASDSLCIDDAGGVSVRVRKA
jgi:hypothetical protein